MINNDKSLKYLDLWKKVFTDCSIVHECRNVLDNFEILLIAPFMSTMLGVFLRTDHVKNVWHNMLTWESLDALLPMGEDDPLCEEFTTFPSIGLISLSNRYLVKCRKLDE